MAKSKITLFLATPSYQGLMDANYTLSMVATADLLARSGVQWTPRFYCGAGYPPVSRGILLSKFMASGYSHMLFVDSDISWQASDITRLVVASKTHEVCCGVYPKKCRPLAFPVNFKQVDGGPVVHPGTGCWELQDACTGFLMIRREAIERMIAAYPERKARFREEVPADEAPYEYNLFDCFTDTDGMYLTEDFGFSRLYQRIGGSLWADPEISLIHHEGHEQYTGKLTDLIVQITTPEIEAAITRAQSIEGWMEPAELAWLGESAAAMASVVEIGCWQGRSTSVLLAACAGPVYAVDHWQGGKDEPEHIRERAKANDNRARFMANVGCSGNLRIIDRPSLEAAPFVDAADMVFIDGGHGYEEVRADIRAWLPKAGRLISGHDFNWPSVRQAVHDELGPVSTGAGSIWFKYLDKAEAA